MNPVLISSFELMWKGMLSIFVVIAAICIVLVIMNKILKKKQPKNESK